MENLFSHLGSLPRRVPCGLPVSSIGYVSDKREWVRRAFSTFNFSFILSGGGEYRCGDFTFAVKAPCVITQWPGVHVEYGPSGAWQSWEELYVIYPPSALPQLQERQLAQVHRPAWRIRSAGEMLGVFERIVAGMARTTEEGMADRLDRLCEAMATEARLGERRPPIDGHEATIREIRMEVQQSYANIQDVGALARAYGMSQVTFRRYWRKYVHVPPAKYVLMLRMREACRLLVESELTIGEIADRLGFGDPLYFSRRFREAKGMPATNYRKLYGPHVKG